MIGIASFDNSFSEQEVDTIHLYLIKQQNDLYELQLNDRTN